ncbi:unnamed protein product [Linum trigynum]|uniref:Uncharacterized protein n=1 Tax=Linum trigynum TaxID=586398 RepID=A0AAV2F890_9ROSI
MKVVVGVSGVTDEMVMVDAEEEGEKLADETVEVVPAEHDQGKQIAFKMAAPSDEEMGDLKRDGDMVDDLTKDPTPVKKLCLEDPIEEMVNDYTKVEEADLDQPQSAK